MDEAERIFATTQSNQDTITVFDHFKISNGGAYLGFDIFWNFEEFYFCRLLLLFRLNIEVKRKCFFLFTIFVDLLLFLRLFFLLFNFKIFPRCFIICRYWIMMLLLILKTKFKRILGFIIVPWLIRRIPFFILLFLLLVELLNALEALVFKS